MGADIHMYIQYKNKKRNDDWWSEFGGCINPGRDYGMFGILSTGVRQDVNNSHDPKGLPEGNLGWAAEDDAYLYIREDSEDYEHSCTLEDALRWGHKIVNDKDGKPWKTLHPDWHSHSWLTTNELSQAFRWYTSQFSGYKVGLEYKAVLSVMKTLGNKGENDVRIVFWFDN
jgi:hypothetical protein